jgi:hypothetical protein
MNDPRHDALDEEFIAAVERDVDPQVEIVALDEPSMEDYPDADLEFDSNVVQRDEFGAPIAQPVKIVEGVRDTQSR